MMSSMISVDRVWGFLAHAMGNVGKAVEHFQDSLSFYRNQATGPNWPGSAATMLTL